MTAHARIVLAQVLILGILGASAALADDEDAGATPAGKLEEARALLEQANALGDEGRFDDAVAAYARAIALLEQNGGGKREIAEALNDLGLAHLDRGAAGEALDTLKRALDLQEEIHREDHADVATSLDNLALALGELGRDADALPLFEEALAMRQRLFKGDHPDIAGSLSNLASTLGALGRYADALPLNQEALTMLRRLFRGDHPDVATSLNNLAFTFGMVGRHADALVLQEEVLAMRRRLFKGDHPGVADSLNNLAFTFGALGRHADALSLQEEALAMRRRIFQGDHPEFARSMNNLAWTLGALGRHDDALRLHEEALAMRRRIFQGDHPDIAGSLSNLASTLGALGRYADALPLNQEALTMLRRLFRGDHPDVATSLNNLAFTFGMVGRHVDALVLQEDVLAMRRRLFQGDHPDIASSLNNLASTLGALGRHDDALRLHEEALAMRRRIFQGNHPDVALSLNNLASTCNARGRHADALQLFEEALAMYRRLLGDDHPSVARGLSNAAVTLSRLGRHADALPLEEEALAMRRRIFKGDHPDVALCLNNLGFTLDALGRHADAVALWHEAAAMGRRLGWPNLHGPLVALGRQALGAGDPESAVASLGEAIEHLETLRSGAHSLGAEEDARYAAEVRERSDPFPLMIEAQVALGKPRDALFTLERGRARATLDLLERGREDPLATAGAVARAQGDQQALRRIEAAQRAVTGAEAAVLQRGREAVRARDEGVRDAFRLAMEAESGARRALEKALRDRLFALRDVLPETSPRSPDEIQALLAPGERMLIYGLGGRASYVFVVRPPGEEIGPVPLAANPGRVTEAVAAYANALAKAGGMDAKVEALRRLFDMAVPEKVWAEVKTAKRVYVLPHGPLHRIPFEALVTGEKDGKPLYWADEGPPVAYAASGSVLAWLRSRLGEAADGAALVAVGDPRFSESGVAWPEKGILVRDLMPDGQAVALGVRPGDVLVAYGGREVGDLATLKEAMGAAPAGAEGVEARFVREGEERALAARPGRLGILFAQEPPPVSGPELLAKGPVASVVRSAASRYGSLPALPGTRKEVEAIRAAFLERRADARVVTLLGADATEERLFAAAKGARYLHLATHGLIDETESASFSALALTRPRVPVPGDDGYLTLADLLERWRGRLDGTALVVLSACESQKGRLERDEGMLALSWGFCFAGAPAAVASLWKVDDESTALLMADFYRRLLSEGAPGPCEALHEARRELRKTHPDPYHWGAFVFVGAP